MKRRRPVSNANQAEQAPSLVHNALHSFATMALSVGLSIISSVVTARALGPAAKGVADLMMATGNLAVVIFGLSLTSGVVYIVARRRANINRLLTQLALIALAQTALAAGVLAALGQTPLAPLLMPREAAGWALPAIALIILGSLLAGYIRSALSGLQQFPRVNIANVTGQALVLSLIVALAAYAWLGGPRLSPFSFISIQIIGLFATASMLFGGLRSLPRAGDAPTGGLREVTRYALPLYLANLAQYLGYRLDIFFVGYLIGVRGVGLYALAVNIAQLLWLVSGAVAQVLLPNIAASDDLAAARERTARIARIILGLNLLFAIGIATVGAALFPLVFGAAFAESVPAIQWLLPGIVAFSVTNVISSYNIGIGKPRRSLWVALVNLATMILLDVILIPAYGIVGASIASTAAYILATFVIISIFIRETGLAPRQVLLMTAADVALLRELMLRMARSIRAT